MELDQLCYVVSEIDLRDEWEQLFDVVNELDMQNEEDCTYALTLMNDCIHLLYNGRLDLLAVAHRLHTRMGNSKYFFNRPLQSLLGHVVLEHISNSDIASLFGLMPVWFTASDENDVPMDFFMCCLFDRKHLATDPHAAKDFLTHLRATPRLQAIAPGCAPLTDPWLGEFDQNTKAWGNDVRQHARALGLIE